MNKIKNSKLSFIKIIFVLSFFELIVGGGGRFLEFGFLTVRMVLFLVIIVISLILYVFRKKIKRNIILLTIIFSIITLTGVVIGLLNNALINGIFEDIKPLSFFYIILFFSLIIKDEKDIVLVSNIIKIGSVILAIVYVGFIIFLYFGLIDFVSFYNKQSEIGEILFRGDFLFFYKGFLYLCIGFFFFLTSDYKYKLLLLVFLFTSIVLTLTRGFILFTFLITCYYIYFINKKILIKIISGILLLVISTLIGTFYLQTVGDRADSDKVRYIQIEQVYDRINPISIFIGHGFGNGVPDRPIHMENSFLEIFHKQGLLGLFFWIAMLFYVCLLYVNIKNVIFKKLALPFLLGVFFVYFQSLTNPFINNPMGLCLLLITIVVFSKLLELQKK
ncbi:O-antigen ligase family protein [Flavobacterium sp. CF136]|uniref:O-antigen ligase family protein n=1 Tax=Flavobacterium sp. (strain CF136) TaxID=1144313 RepID=UPI0002715221|nr:O-antigen ligase family protein [Flavobacterium sp. CF136]EJL66732.1 hypothetical protein PMI10_00310 [Flavobacterium sp. CF136]